MRAKALFQRQELVLALLVVLEWFLFNTLGPRFGSAANQADILRHSAEIGLLALAMTPIVLTGGIDLSVGSLLGLCATVFGALWRDAHWPVGLAAGGALGVGMLSGLLNAWFITRLQLPALIVTLGTFSLYRGLAEALTRGVDTYTNFPSGFLSWGQGEFAGMPAQLLPFVLILACYWYLVHRSVQGRSYRMIGYAREGAHYAGIPVQRREASVYILAGLVVGVASLLYTARLGQARADAGTGYELYAITAVVLGGTSIFGGAGTLYGTVLGVIALALLKNGLVHARKPTEMAGLLTGALLLLALLSNQVLARLRNRPKSSKPTQS